MTLPRPGRGRQQMFHVIKESYILIVNPLHLRILESEALVGYFQVRFHRLPYLHVHKSPFTLVELHIPNILPQAPARHFT